MPTQSCIEIFLDGMISEDAKFKLQSRWIIGTGDSVQSLIVQHLRMSDVVSLPVLQRRTTCKIQ